MTPNATPPPHFPATAPGSPSAPGAIGPIPSSIVAIFAQRRLACRRCPTPCDAPPVFKLQSPCPLSPPRWAAVPAEKLLGLGDLVEKLAKPIARALNLRCLDDQDNLKPDSPCARRKALMNRVGVPIVFRRENG